MFQFSLKQRHLNYLYLFNEGLTMYITIALSVLLILSIYYYLRQLNLYGDVKLLSDEIEKKYLPIITEENKLNELSSEYSKLQSAYQTNLFKLKQNESRLSQFNIGVGTTDSVSYRRLQNTNSVDALESELSAVKAQIKVSVSEKRACVCSMGSDFVVNDSKAEAKKLLNREVKLRLRCLDNDFKAAETLADWNNMNRLIQRTKDTFNEINASADMIKTYINGSYLKLKTKELQLGYEISKLKQDIKEEGREEARIIREAKREETRIIAAAEKAEKSRILMEKLVAEELSKLESSSEEQKALYELHKEELEILKDKEIRAVSLAQKTRAGYVYVISNELSFGKGICKIGMTRRADPNDRVKELGDASVPELFSVHAFAFTEDAPQLENYLHKQFSEQRVNLVNRRKEFFHVTPEEVLQQLSSSKFDYELSEQF